MCYRKVIVEINPRTDEIHESKHIIKARKQLEKLLLWKTFLSGKTWLQSQKKERHKAQRITRVDVIQSLGSILVIAKCHIILMRMRPKRKSLHLEFICSGSPLPEINNSLYSCDQNILTALSLFITLLSTFFLLSVNKTTMVSCIWLYR